MKSIRKNGVEVDMIGLLMIAIPFLVFAYWLGDFLENRRRKKHTFVKNVIYHSKFIQFVLYYQNSRGGRTLLSKSVDNFKCDAKFFPVIWKSIEFDQYCTKKIQEIRDYVNLDSQNIRL